MIPLRVTDGGPNPKENFTQHVRGPVIDVYEASTVAMVGHWLVVTAANSSGQDVSRKTH